MDIVSLRRPYVASLVRKGGVDALKKVVEHLVLLFGAAFAVQDKIVQVDVYLG